MNSTYEVVRGDTLDRIARKVLQAKGVADYGAVHVQQMIDAIVADNRDRVHGPHKHLWVGETLNLSNVLGGITGPFAGASVDPAALPPAIASPARPIKVSHASAAAPFAGVAGGLVDLKDPAKVNIIQEGLAALGYNPGPQDDKWGPKTRTALEAWQLANGHAAGLPTPGQLEELRRAAANPAAARAAQREAAAQDPGPAPRAYGLGRGGERMVANAERELQGQPPEWYFSLAHATTPQELLVLDKGHFQRMANGRTDHGVYSKDETFREVDLDPLSDDVARLVWEEHGIPVVTTRASGEVFFLGKSDDYVGRDDDEHYGHLDGRVAFAERVAQNAGVPLDRVSFVSFHADSTNPSHSGPTLYTHPGDDGSARFAEVAAEGLDGGDARISDRGLNVLERAEEGGLGAAAVLEVGNVRNKGDEQNLKRIASDSDYRLQVAREMAASIAKAHRAIQPDPALQYAGEPSQVAARVPGLG